MIWFRLKEMISTVESEYMFLSDFSMVLIYIFKMGMYQFGLQLAVTSYRCRHHGDASSASL